MVELDPREHYIFTSYGGALKLNIPLVIDEHENTGITVTAVRSNSDKEPLTTVQISTSGALVLKDNGAEKEANQIKKKIAVGGNDSFHIQTPITYEYPSGTEGECVAQANILLRKLDMIESEEVPSDSLSVDLYIRRKLLNVFKAMWKTANGLIVNLGSSAVITSLVVILTFFLGKDLAGLIPEFLSVFVVSVLAVSFLYSWYTRDKLIRKRLECNSMYLKLKEVSIEPN